MKEYKILIVDRDELEWLTRVLDMVVTAGAVEEEESLTWMRNACSEERQGYLRDLPQSIRE